MIDKCLGRNLYLILIIDFVQFLWVQGGYYCVWGLEGKFVRMWMIFRVELIFQRNFRRESFFWEYVEVIVTLEFLLGRVGFQFYFLSLNGQEVGLFFIRQVEVFCGFISFFLCFLSFLILSFSFCFMFVYLCFSVSFLKLVLLFFLQ